jgi:leucyl aminopeptidase
VSTTLSITDTPAHQVDADALVVAACTGPAGPRPAPGVKDVDDALGGTLAATLAALGATGEAGEVTKIASGGRLTAPLIVAVGIGADSGDAPIEPEVLRRAAGAAVRAVVSPGGNGQAGQRRIALALPARDQVEAEAVALGALLGSYTFRRYRSEPAAQATLTLLAGGSHAAEAARRAEVLATAVNLVRDLVNTGPSDLVPATFADRAGQIAAQAGMDIAVLDEEALAGGGYGGILGVGQGSVHPPRLVRLEYAPPQASKVLVLAGKGITFDSGGLSLKPAKAMETMKSDMGGAAAVLGAMQAIAALGLSVRVIGYLPLAENMPSGTAQRPSDVLTIYGGTTVEVLNTDAEGRLVLADALAYLAEQEPACIVDTATLTGACMIALGTDIAGAMGTSDDLARELIRAGAAAGEPIWQLPLHPDYRKLIDSKVADIKNIGKRYGGAITAAWFLAEFVGDVPWVHLDIAGPAFSEHGNDLGPAGATGMPVRTLVGFLQARADGTGRR